MDTRTLCLAVLSLGDASPYDIQRKVEDTFTHFMDVAPSGIYAAVKALEQEGLITGAPALQSGRPTKTVYHLREEGRLALSRALGGMEGRHRIRSELVALLMFAHLLPPEKLRTVLTSRIAELENLEADLESHGPQPLPGQSFALDMGRCLVTAELGFLKSRAPALLLALDDDGRLNASGAVEA